MQAFQLSPIRLILTVAAVALSSLSTTAPAVQFTNQCANALTAADRTLFEDAADLLDEYRNAVERHINDARAGGNPDNYSFIDPALMADWRGVVDDMLSGDVKIACEYNGMTFNTCARNPGKLGMEIEIQPGRIHVCIDNVRANSINPFGGTTTPVPGLPVALLAGTIAHELMHIVDGFLVGHSGSTNVLNPDTAAETIGVAIEHLILTPDLDATIQSLDISCCDQNENAVLIFDVLVKNMNTLADTQLRAVSDQFRAAAADSPEFGFTRNTRSLLKVEVNGEAQQQSVNALEGSASTIKSFVFHMPPYEIAGDGIHDIVAAADFNNVFFENSEINNFDEASVSTAVDVSLGVEVAEPPECHSMEYRDDVYPPGYYSWIDIPFRAEVVNLDLHNTAPRVDVVMTFDDMWSNTSQTSQEIIWTDSLPPQDRRDVIFHLNVPADPSCGGPLGDTQVWFEADGNAQTLNDVDRSNNSVELVVNEDYWQPDYVIRSVDQVGVGLDTRTVGYAVRNIGPTNNFTNGPSLLASTQVKDESDSILYFSAFARSLEPGEQQAFEATLPVDECDTSSFLISADNLDVINEYDENNNVTQIWLEPLPQGNICTTFGAPVDDLGPGLDWIEENGTTVLYDKFDSLNTVESGSDRATGVELGSGPPILDELNP